MIVMKGWVVWVDRLCSVWVMIFLFVLVGVMISVFVFELLMVCS